MKASELIKELQKQIDENGDLIVQEWDGSGMALCFREIENVKLTIEKQEKFIELQSGCW